MRILCIFGTRPEAIKMAPVVAGLAGAGADVVVCVTAQHRGMLDQVLKFFGIVPDHDLDLMQPAQSLSGLFGRVIAGVDDVLALASPDVALVHGDTTTACAAALACFHSQVPIGHVEAGLRSGDLGAPFPEEMNRVVIDAFADHLFAPTEAAAGALRSEGRGEERIAVTGNTVIDSLLAASARLDADLPLRRRIDAHLPPAMPGRRSILVTGHRRESFGAGFERFCRALRRLADRRDVQIVYPVHSNPSVQAPVRAALDGLDNVALIEPVDYPSFIRLMQSADLVITDSGGVQEEAPSFGKPVLVTRDVTERREAVDAGTVRMVGTDEECIVAEATILLDDEAARRAMARRINPYGDGRAVERIAGWLGLPGAAPFSPFSPVEHGVPLPAPKQRERIIDE